MRSQAWNRTEVISLLRRDIWRYITQASIHEEDLLLWAASLLQMPSSEVRYLAQLQFILSDAVADLLRQMPTLIRRLTTTTAADVEISRDRVRGAIRWSETYGYRAATGSSHVFVTAPTQRVFDTAENHVLAFALFAIADFGKRTGWHKGTVTGPAAAVRTRVAEATRWLQARQLIDLPKHPPAATTLTRVRTGRARLRYQAALDVVDLYQRYIAKLDRHSIRDAVERHALLASRDSVLLELYCAFDVIRTLRRLGWHTPPPGLIRPPIIFRGTQGLARAELSYQSTPAALSAGSLYRKVQTEHEFSAVGGLIPDLVLRITTGDDTRWLLIEVKGGSKRSLADSARLATKDLFAYRRAFAATLDQQTAPFGLGYAWGARLLPTINSDVTLCTPDTLTDALALLLT